MCVNDADTMLLERIKVKTFNISTYKGLSLSKLLETNCKLSVQSINTFVKVYNACCLLLPTGFNKYNSKYNTGKSNTYYCAGLVEFLENIRASFLFRSFVHEE